MKDYPDFLQRTRITYGDPVVDHTYGVLAAQGWNTLYNITDRGYIYYLDIWFYSSVSHEDDIIRVTLDGSAFPDRTIAHLRNQNAQIQDVAGMHLAQFDESIFQYRISGMRGYTFETSILVEFNCVPATLPTVWRTLIYGSL